MVVRFMILGPYMLFFLKPNLSLAIRLHSYFKYCPNERTWPTQPYSMQFILISVCHKSIFVQKMQNRNLFRICHSMKIFHVQSIFCSADSRQKSYEAYNKTHMTWRQILYFCNLKPQRMLCQNFKKKTFKFPRSLHNETSIIQSFTFSEFFSFKSCTFITNITDRRTVAIDQILKL